MSQDLVHIIDSPYYAHIYASEEMRAVFDDRRRWQRWLDIEAALAGVQASLGVIPAEAAAEIGRKARLELLDLDFIKRELAASGHSLMPLLKAVSRVCAGGHGEYIHYGPTTQDIEDTGGVLELRDALRLLARDLLRGEALLLPLAEKYAALPMAGRTHNQQGLPITLGLKFAGWAAELRRNIERLKDLKKRLFVLMLHGGTGTMAGLGEHALATAHGLAAELGLELPPTGWGSSRDNFAEYQCALGLICGTCARICNEIYQLSRSEIGELHEPLGVSYVGSSTMAHKLNAEKCAMNVAVCRIVMNNSLLGLQAMLSEHERDTRAWRLDWHSLPESSVLAAGALSVMNKVLEGLVIDAPRIGENLDRLKGLLFSEAVMFLLGERTGKLSAHEIVHRAAMRAQAEGLDFKQALLEEEEFSRWVSRSELENIMDYSRHVGTAVRQTAQVAECAGRYAGSDAELF